MEYAPYTGAFPPAKTALPRKTKAHFRMYAHQDKTLRSSQAATPEKQQQRLEYWSEIKRLETKDLVFLDEMGVLLSLRRTRARSLLGQRAYNLQPFYRGKRIIVIGAITHDYCLGIKTLDKGMNGEDFQQFLQQELAPKLWSGAVVVMDNLPAHKVKGVTKIIEEQECKSSLFIPLFS